MKVWYESGKFYRLRNIPTIWDFLESLLNVFLENKVW